MYNLSNLQHTAIHERRRKTHPPRKKRPPLEVGGPRLRTLNRNPGTTFKLQHPHVSPQQCSLWRALLQGWSLKQSPFLLLHELYESPTGLQSAHQPAFNAESESRAAATPTTPNPLLSKPQNPLLLLQRLLLHPYQKMSPLKICPPQRKDGAPPSQSASPTSWTTCKETSSSPLSVSTT